MSEYDEGKDEKRSLVHIFRFRENKIEVKLKYSNGRKCLRKKVFCPNPQKFLPQKVRNLSTAKVFSAKFYEKANFSLLLP